MHMHPIITSRVFWISVSEDRKIKRISSRTRDTVREIEVCIAVCFIGFPQFYITILKYYEANFFSVKTLYLRNVYYKMMKNEKVGGSKEAHCYIYCNIY